MAKAKELARPPADVVIGKPNPPMPVLYFPEYPDRVVEKVPSRCPVTGEPTDLFYVRPPKDIGPEPYGVRTLETPSRPQKGTPIGQPASLNDGVSDRGRFRRIRDSIRFRVYGEAATKALQLDEEIARCRAHGMTTIADIMESNRPTDPVEPLFFGVIKVHLLWLSQGLAGMDVGDTEALALVERHAGGDFGDFGTLESGRAEVNAESRWAPPLYGQAVRNALVIDEQGSGLILSSFPIYRPKLDQGGTKRHPESRVRVATLLAMGEPSQTLVYTSTDGTF